MLANRIVSMTAHVLCAIGAINWGLVAFLGMDIVSRATMMVGMPQLDKIIYGVIALSGVYVLLAVCGCGFCRCE